MPKDESAVLLQQDGQVGIITLSRPDRLNAVNHRLRQQLTEVLGGVNADTGIRAVVLTGEGERAFCAGQDLEESAALPWQDLVRWLTAQRNMLQAVRDLDKPCVAAVNGVAVGVGFQLALCADFRIIAPGTRIGQPEVRAGLASILGSYLMSLHTGLSHNAALSLSGELITGQRAYEIGLVTELAPAEEVLATAMGKAHMLAALPATAMRVTRKRFREMTQAGFDEAVLAGVRAQLECYAEGEPQRLAAEFLARRRGTAS